MKVKHILSPVMQLFELGTMDDYTMTGLLKWMYVCMLAWVE